MKRLIFLLSLLAAPALGQSTANPPQYKNGSTNLGRPRFVQCSAVSCTMSAGTLTLSSASTGNWSFSANDAATSGSPMSFTVNSVLGLTLSSSRIAIFGDGTTNGRIGTTNCYTNYNEAGGSTILQCGGSLTLSGAAATLDVQAREPTAKMTDTSAKGTCDATVDGTIKYEVAANVGTLYVCHQTGVGTYAWVALH